jgi:hypothetical protein
VKFGTIAVLLAAGLLMSRLCVTPALAVSVAGPTERAGQNDFNFLAGRWRTHYKRLRHPLSNDHVWYGCDGTSFVRPLWKGNANIEDGDLRRPAEYIRGMTLRLYDRASHQWSLYWASEKSGLSIPPQVGHFNADGVGDFYANDTFAGKPIIVRYRWTILRGNHPHFEQAFSADRGKTWETNWTTDYARLAGLQRAYPD